MIIIMMRACMMNDVQQPCSTDKQLSVLSATSYARLAHELTGRHALVDMHWYNGRQAMYASSQQHANNMAKKCVLECVAPLHQNTGTYISLASNHFE